MSNGLRFPALTFWKKTEVGRVQLVWLDEIGKSDFLEGVVDPARRKVWVHHLDPGEDGSQQWQRIVFRVLSSDEYVELLYAETAGEWEQVGEFRFERTKPAER